MSNTPWIPKATFQVDGSSQTSMEKFANTGLQIGYNTDDRDWWIMTAKNSPVNARCFYIGPFTLGGTDYYYLCACSNVQPTDPNYLQLTPTPYRLEQNPSQYIFGLAYLNVLFSLFPTAHPNEELANP